MKRRYLDAWKFTKSFQIHVLHTGLKGPCFLENPRVLNVQILIFFVEYWDYLGVNGPLGLILGIYSYRVFWIYMIRWWTFGSITTRRRQSVYFILPLIMDSFLPSMVSFLYIYIDIYNMAIFKTTHYNAHHEVNFLLIIRSSSTPKNFLLFMT